MQAITKQVQAVAERAKITAFEQADNRQEAAKGASQQATQDQAAATKSLNEWLAKYIKIARVALRGCPQLLEKIGVFAPTDPSAAARKAAAATKQPVKAEG